jgi:hypothetical protein
MENPAKRTRLAPKELSLLDLDDDVQIMIINRLDHESKMQMMATCKRFEGLIGHTHQFYKNFELELTQQKIAANPDRWKNIQRKFGFVKIVGISQEPKIVEIMKRIGANVMEVQLDDLQVTDVVFLELMKLLSNLRELTISGLENILESELSSPGFKLKHLIKLEIQAVTNLKIFGMLVPNSLKILKLSENTSSEMETNPCWDAEILAKQTRLEELILDGFKINVFEFDPENCHIRKLEVRKLAFLNQLSFKKFSDFMKIQESVAELELSIGDGELKNHDYAGILTHLLSLKSLKKLAINCHDSNEIFTVFSKFNLCNPVVDTLIIQNLASGANLKWLPKFFPSVTDLKITWPDSDFLKFFDTQFLADLKPINSMKIRKLEIDFLTEQMLVDLDLKQMQELIIKSGLLSPLKAFFTKHCQLKTFHITVVVLRIGYLPFILETLPLLKSLELELFGYTDACSTEITPQGELQVRREKELSEKAARLIGENYARFEHLKLNFGPASRLERIILDFLGKHYPGVTLRK